MSDRGLSLEKKRREALLKKRDDFRALVLQKAYGPSGPYFPIKNNFRFAPLNLKGFLTTRYWASALYGADKVDGLPDHET